MKQIFTLHEPIGKVQSGADLFKKIKELKIDYTQENLIVFYLNTKSQVIKAEILFKGGLSCCVVDPKILFKNALLNNSDKIIIAHNHPSKCLEPSSEDINTFQGLKEAGDIITIEILDSIIFNENEFYSLLDSEKLKGGLN